uniref:Protein kinase domain-containing protein n=1 Tax=Zea mays TaxID=4577 RepID=B6SYZ0_MAIZE|nr:hypothetical protein [Zea mays]
MPPPRLLPPIIVLLLLAPPAAPQPAPGSEAAPQQDGLRCLRGVKHDLADPNGRLADWDFKNTSGGAVYSYSGIGCWNLQESRVLSLSLSGFGLVGSIPSSLQYCSAATTLDLSSNALVGTILPALCDWLPFLVTLDLSSNQLTGAIPAELANCRFLNSLTLSGSSRAGTAYRAVLRDGSALTVKRLHSCPLSEKAFRAEMCRIGQLRHPNIVPLLGFCVVEDERLLVYKHMESGALSSVMKKKPGEEAPLLDWATRLRIAVGAARGLAWLHHGFQVPQIHQNLSSSAVLLDEDYEARITDVGLTRLVRMAPGEGGDTSPFLKGDLGEFGYVAPECASNPVGTTKGDAYAFGVVLFELVSGQEAAAAVGTVDVTGEGFKGTLVDWVYQLKASGRIGDAVDKSLRGKGHEAEIEEFLKVAFACTQPRVRERHSMYRVYHALKSIGEGRDATEQFDEFPLAYNKDDSDTM